MIMHTLVTAMIGVLMLSGAHAQSPADFYRGRTVDFYIGYSVGAGYDIYARLVAKHLAKHIPGNPTVVAKNMEGAGSLRLANYLYNIAPKDGTAIGALSRGAAFEPMFGTPGVQFDAEKMHWWASANNEVSICATWHAAGFKTIDDLKQREAIMGGSGGAADTDQFVYVLNGVLGTKMKVVAGYPGGNEINLAVERGEVQGRCGWSWASIKSTHPHWLREGKVDIQVQLSLSKHADLPNLPLVMDLAKTDDERQIFRLVFARNVMGRPFVSGPGIPADRAAALRAAFEATLRDPELRAEADKINLEVNPVSGEEIQKIVLDAHRTPAAIVRRTGELLKGPN